MRAAEWKASGWLTGGNILAEDVETQSSDRNRACFINIFPTHKPLISIGGKRWNSIDETLAEEKAS
jgi:hypothetical protein